MDRNNDQSLHRSASHSLHIHYSYQFFIELLILRTSGSLTLMPTLGTLHLLITYLFRVQNDSFCFISLILIAHIQLIMGVSLCLLPDPGTLFSYRIVLSSIDMRVCDQSYSIFAVSHLLICPRGHSFLKGNREAVDFGKKGGSGNERRGGR